MQVASLPRITSRQHDVVKRLRRVARGGPDGDDSGRVIIDGEHLLIEALDAGLRAEIVLTVQPDHAAAIRARAAGGSVYAVTSAVLDAASPVRTPSGLVALVHWAPASLPAAMAGSPALVIGLCGVQDPGNVGSAIRGSDALGATGVLALDDTAYPGGWKALRGAMGSTFHLPVATGTSADAIGAARGLGLRVVAAVAAGGEPPDRIDLRRPTLVLLGSEGAGLPGEVVSQADGQLTIPMRAQANSLNVAVSAALILYEARRQRAPAS